MQKVSNLTKIAILCRINIGICFLNKKQSRGIIMKKLYKSKLFTYACLFILAIAIFSIPMTDLTKHIETTDSNFESNSNVANIQALDGTLQSSTTFYTEDKPYTIKTPQEWNAFAKLVNDGNSFENQYVALIDNIYFDLVDLVSAGTLSNPFMGNFCGFGYTIYNISKKIPRVSTSKNTEDNFGLFGVIRNASISQIIIHGFDLISNMVAGCLVGRAEGNCKISSISISAVSLQHNSLAQVWDPNERVSLRISFICGYALPETGQANGSLTIDDVHIFNSSIKSGYRVGNMVIPQDVGGIVGKSQDVNLTIANTYSSGSVVSFVDKNIRYLGGLVGYTDGTNTTTKILNSQINARVGSYENLGTNTAYLHSIGGMVGYGNNVTISNCATLTMDDWATFTSSPCNMFVANGKNVLIENCFFNKWAAPADKKPIETEAITPTWININEVYTSNNNNAISALSKADSLQNENFVNSATQPNDNQFATTTWGTEKYRPEQIALMEIGNIKISKKQTEIYQNSTVQDIRKYIDCAVYDTNGKIISEKANVNKVAILNTGTEILFAYGGKQARITNNDSDTTNDYDTPYIVGMDASISTEFLQNGKTRYLHSEYIFSTIRDFLNVYDVYSDGSKIKNTKYTLSSTTTGEHEKIGSNQIHIRATINNYTKDLYLTPRKAFEFCKTGYKDNSVMRAFDTLSLDTINAQFSATLYDFPIGTGGKQNVIISANNTTITPKNADGTNGKIAQNNLRAGMKTADVVCEINVNGAVISERIDNVDINFGGVEVSKINLLNAKYSLVAPNNRYTGSVIVPSLKVDVSYYPWSEEIKTEIINEFSACTLSNIKFCVDAGEHCLGITWRGLKNIENPYHQGFSFFILPQIVDDPQFTTQIEFTGKQVLPEVTNLNQLFSFDCTSQTDAGTYPIVFNMTNKNYTWNDGQTLQKSWEITKKDIDASNFKWKAPASFVFNDANQTILLDEASLLAGMSITGYEGNQQSQAGDYTAICNLNGGKNYNITRNPQTSWKITPAPIFVSDFVWSDFSVYKYDSNTKSVVILSGLPNGLVVDRYTGNSATNQGNYTANVYFKPNSNYSIADNSFNWSIGFGNYDMTNTVWNYQDSFTYDGQFKEITLSNLPLGVTATYENNKFVDAGEYRAIAKFAYDTQNYNAPSVKACDWKINKVAITKPYKDETKRYVYNASQYVLDLLNFKNNCYSITNNQKTNAGEYEAIITLRKNYEWNCSDLGQENNSDDLKIGWQIERAKIALNVTFEDTIIVADGLTHSISINGSLPNFVFVNYVGNEKTDVGVYDVTANFNVDENNYFPIESLHAKMTIRYLILNNNDDVKISTKEGFDPNCKLNVNYENDKNLDFARWSHNVYDTVSIFVENDTNNYVNNTLKIKILIDEKFKSKDNLAIFYRTTNNELVKMDSKIEGDYLVFETQNFGDFVIGIEENKIAEIIIVSVLSFLLIGEILAIAFVNHKLKRKSKENK